MSDESVNRTLYEISQILDSQLDSQSIEICRELIDLGVHPETVVVSGEYFGRFILTIQSSNRFRTKIKRIIISRYSLTIL